MTLHSVSQVPQEVLSDATVKQLAAFYVRITWGMTLAVIVFVMFFFVGVAHILYPDWFVRWSGSAKGGEESMHWNRLQFRISGAVFTGGAVWML